MADQLLTEKELCEWLQLSRSTLHQLRKNLELPHILLGNCIRYSKEDIERWLRSHKHLVATHRSENHKQGATLPRNAEEIGSEANDELYRRRENG